MEHSSHSCIKTHDKTAQYDLARGAVTPFNRRALASHEPGHAGHIRAAVRNDGSRLSAPHSHPIPEKAEAGECGACGQRQIRTGEVVENDLGLSATNFSEGTTAEAKDHMVSESPCVHRICVWSASSRQNRRNLLDSRRCPSIQSHSAHRR